MHHLAERFALIVRGHDGRNGLFGGVGKIDRRDELAQQLRAWGSVISGSEKRSTLAEPAVVKMAAMGSPKARLPTIPEARLLNVDVERMPWMPPFLLMLSRAFSTPVMRTCMGNDP